MASGSQIEDFYRDHARSVLAFLVSLSRDRSLAEDLMQETFAKATRSLGGYRGGSPRAWLFSIARSVFIDHVRRHPTVLGDPPEPPPTADPDIAERDAINRALAALPERQRSALLLADHIGLPGPEVAKTIGITPGAARVLIHRARLAFRAAYDEERP